MYLLSERILIKIGKQSKKYGTTDHARPKPSAPSVMAISKDFSKFSKLECSDKQIILKQVCACKEKKII